MGYRGKVAEQERARQRRARGLTLQAIATELGVARSSVSLWVRDVRFEPSPRQRPTCAAPHPLHGAKLAEIEALDREGEARLGVLSEDAFLAAGAALYAGEGGKTDGEVNFANTDPGMVRFFCAWFRRFFEPDEARLRVRVYLHESLDLEAATAHRSTVTGVSPSQFMKPYRPPADPTIRRTKHQHGCVHVRYCSTTAHRQVMGVIRALLSSEVIPG
jgi:transcriptional regulator with XRE-family HTH domain